MAGLKISGEVANIWQQIEMKTAVRRTQGRRQNVSQTGSSTRCRTIDSPISIYGPYDPWIDIVSFRVKS